MSETTNLMRRLLERGLTQTEIASKTLIPQPRLSRWANDDAPIGADDALKLAQFERELIAADQAKLSAP